MIYDSRNSQGGKTDGGPGGGGGGGPMGKSWNVTFYDYSSSLEGSGEVGPDYGKRAFIAIVCEALHLHVQFLNSVVFAVIRKQVGFEIY